MRNASSFSSQNYGPDRHAMCLSHLSVVLGCHRAPHWNLGNCTLQDNQELFGFGFEMRSKIQEHVISMVLYKLCWDTFSMSQLVQPPIVSIKLNIFLIRTSVGPKRTVSHSRSANHCARRARGILQCPQYRRVSTACDTELHVWDGDISTRLL